MSYRPPDQTTAFRLLDEILELLRRCGGPYADGVEGICEAAIIRCIKSGQFIYKKNHYFVCWYYWDRDNIEWHLKNEAGKGLLFDIKQGQHMRSMEVGVLKRFHEMKRKWKKKFRSGGVSWRRSKNNKQVMFLGDI